jgi:hypothetical protein
MVISPDNCRRIMLTRRTVGNAPRLLAPSGASPRADHLDDPEAALGLGEGEPAFAEADAFPAVALAAILDPIGVKIARVDHLPFRAVLDDADCPVSLPA